MKALFAPLYLFISCFVLWIHPNTSETFTPVTIAPDSDASISLELVQIDVQFRCEFSYASLPSSTVPKLNEINNKEGLLSGLGFGLAWANSNSGGATTGTKNPDLVLGRLAGVCTSKTMDYWTYQVCFEDKITQSHASHIHSLGRYSHMNEKHQQMFNQGAPCEALPQQGFPPRQTTVQFVCAESLGIISIEEVSTCMYKFTVSTPLVCGFDESIFPKLQSLNTLISASGNGRDTKKRASLTDDEKDKNSYFFFEMFTTVVPQDAIGCRVTKLEGEPLRFSRFNIKIVQEPLPQSSLDTKNRLDKTELLPVIHSVKTSKGMPMDVSFYKIEDDGKGKDVRLASTRQFKGDMAYASLLVKPRVPTGE